MVRNGELAGLLAQVPFMSLCLQRVPFLWGQGDAHESFGPAAEEGQRILLWEKSGESKRDLPASVVCSNAKALYEAWGLLQAASEWDLEMGFRNWFRKFYW